MDSLVPTSPRHCERSGAIQGQEEKLDCFVARAPRNDVDSLVPTYLSPSLRAKRSNPGATGTSARFIHAGRPNGPALAGPLTGSGRCLIRSDRQSFPPPPLRHGAQATSTNSSRNAPHATPCCLIRALSGSWPGLDPAIRLPYLQSRTYLLSKNMGIAGHDELRCTCARQTR